MAVITPDPYTQEQVRQGVTNAGIPLAGLERTLVRFNGSTISDGDTYDTGLASIVEVAFVRSSGSAASVTFDSTGLLTFNLNGGTTAGGVWIFHQGY